MDTIQDAGRYGYRYLGINPSGAMDHYALSVANFLTGNSSNDAVIELHFPAASVFFEQPALIAITGADFSPTINAEEVPMYQPILINKFGILQFEGFKKGARAYLAVSGGLNISKWLNSFSTHLRASAGGLNGKGLQKDDEIPLNGLNESYKRILGKEEFIVLPWKADDVKNENTDNEILVLPGNEWGLLSNQAKDDFLNQSYTITINSDRMGYRLDTKQPLFSESKSEMISSAVSFGTVQLLPDGKLIVLMADHQATGGYPKLAHVITAHHSKLAQMKAGDKFHFGITSIEKAEEMMIERYTHLGQLQNGCKYRLQNFIER